MARLTSIYRTEDGINLNIGRRQLPVVAGENLMMLMDLSSKGLVIDSPQIRGKELEEFTRKFNLLTKDELRQSLSIDGPTFISVLNQCVQCVGCRRRVEHLFYQLTDSGHPTLDPLVWKNACILSINEEKMRTPQALGTILYRHHDVLNNLLDCSKLRNKTRCMLHSLDAFRSKPFAETWRDVWSSMKQNCREELAVIETKELHEVLDNYLKKHKFCQGCRTKIEKAYKILVGESNAKEKGYVAALYANIKRCHPDKHIHVVTKKIDFLDALIRRAEPEVNGSYSKQRERHAKTLEIAQEEVLTCIGMIMYERLRRIYVSLREEERACQVLAAVGVHALCRSFDIFVEQKQGISNLELLYKEISRAEKAKEMKREQRKLKKKKKKHEKKNSHRICEVSSANDDADISVDDDDDDDDAEASDVAPDVEEADDEAVVVDADADVCDGDDFDDNDDILSKVATAAIENKANVTAQMERPQMQAKKKGSVLQKQKQSSKRNKKKSLNNKRAMQNDNCDKSLSPTPIISVERQLMSVKCTDCLAPTPNCPCDIKDSGYGSEPQSRGQSRTSSVVCSPEGSEVSCSDGFCNHGEQHCNTGNDSDSDPNSVQHCDNESCESLVCQRKMQTLSLQQMLDDFDEEKDADEENCYIPQEVVLKYQYQYEIVQQQRQQLRETLRENFARLCKERGALSSSK